MNFLAYMRHRHLKNNRLADRHQTADQLLEVRKLGFEVVALTASALPFSRCRLGNLDQKERHLQRIEDPAAHQAAHDKKRRNADDGEDDHCEKNKERRHAVLLYDTALLELGIKP